MTPSQKLQRDQLVGQAFACRQMLLADADASLADYARVENLVQSASLAVVRRKVFEAVRERKRLVTTEDTLLHEAIGHAFEDAREIQSLNRNNRPSPATH